MGFSVHRAGGNSMCFLIMHLATHFYMDDDLGFTPPKPYAFLWRNAEPQIAVHPLRGDWKAFEKDCQVRFLFVPDRLPPAA